MANAKINLRLMTFKQVVAYSWRESGKTKLQVHENTGIPMASLSRFLQEHDDYSPGMIHIPALCESFGNYYIVDWLNAQICEMRGCLSIESPSELSVAVMQCTENTGHLCAKVKAAVADNKLTPEEASLVQGQAMHNALHNWDIAKALEPLARKLRKV